MKTNVLIAILFLFTLSAFAQESDSTLTEMKNELNSDTTNIRFKRKTVKIIEEDEGTKILVQKNGDCRHTIWSDDENRFKGSWSGFSVGMSNYLDKDFSLSRNADNEFMDLNTGKSWNMNLNFAQYS